MRRLLALSAVLSLHGAVALADAPLQGDLTAGRALFEQHCQECHGANGVGTSKGSRLADSNKLNALSNSRLLQIMREGTLKSAEPAAAAGKDKKKKASSAGSAARHFVLPAELTLLDAWDVVGFLRSRTVDATSFFPEADRYVTDTYAPDNFGLERLEKSTGKKFTAEDARLYVFTLYKTGWGGATQLIPNDPKVLDKLKKNMKQGYVVATPLEGQDTPTQVVLALDPKTFAIVNIRAHTQDGTALPELDKQLTRFVGKGDRRVSGGNKSTLKAGGGGKQFAALEGAVTEAFVRAAEAVTAYEIVERDRTWADDDL